MILLYISRIKNKISERKNKKGVPNTHYEGCMCMYRLMILRKITNLKIFSEKEKTDRLANSRSVLNPWRINFCVLSNVYTVNDVGQPGTPTA